MRRERVDQSQSINAIRSRICLQFCPIMDTRALDTLMATPRRPHSYQHYRAPTLSSNRHQIFIAARLANLAASHAAGPYWRNPVNGR